MKWIQAGPLPEKTYKVPILAAAMDGVVDVKFAVAMGKLGGLAVLNLDGIQTRYDDPDEVLEKIAKASPEEATKLVQSIYLKPVKEKLIARRIKEIKSHKVPAVVSCIPQNAKEFSAIAQARDAIFSLFSQRLRPPGIFPVNTRCWITASSAAILKSRSSSVTASRMKWLWN